MFERLGHSRLPDHGASQRREPEPQSIARPDETGRTGRRMHASVMPAMLLTVLVVVAVAVEDGCIEGEIRSAETGERLTGAYVQLRNDVTDQAVETTTSDEQASFMMEEIPVGTYVLEVRYAGYESLTRDVEVADGDTLQLQLNLRPSRR